MVEHEFFRVVCCASIYSRDWVSGVIARAVSFAKCPLRAKNSNRLVLPSKVSLQPNLWSMAECGHGLVCPLEERLYCLLSCIMKRSTEYRRLFRGYTPSNGLIFFFFVIPPLSCYWRPVDTRFYSHLLTLGVRIGFFRLIHNVCI